MTSNNNRDLLLAILAMDSYNHEYGEGIAHGATIIGSAILRKLPQGTNIKDWQSAGFYAAAYDLPDGATVISFRGTDDARDVAHGWVMALGDVTDHTQASLALDFYEKVAQQAWTNGAANNVVLTGHSLGG